MKVTHLDDHKRRTYQFRIDEAHKPEIDAKYPEKKSKGRPALIAADKLKVDMEIEAMEKVSNYDCT